MCGLVYDFKREQRVITMHGGLLMETRIKTNRQGRPGSGNAAFVGLDDVNNNQNRQSGSVNKAPVRLIYDFKKASDHNAWGEV
jgi:hypothetical protein